MKKLFLKSLLISRNLILLIFSLGILTISCRKEEPVVETKKGMLVFDLGLDIEVKDVTDRLKSMENTDNFQVNIFYADGNLAMTYATAIEIPDTVWLEPGEYYLEAHSNNDLPAAFENPYYFGRSMNFTISSDMRETVHVNCSLANTMVSVIYESDLANYYTGYSTTVSTAHGSLEYISTETRPGYFRTAPMDILVELTLQDTDGNSTIRNLNGAINNPLPGRHYEIHVSTSIQNGNAGFELVLDNNEVPVEIVEISDEEDPVPEGPIGYGELLITEIMSNPDALSDTEGEWFEIYNNSVNSINLENLVLTRNGTDRHVISGNIELLPGEYYVLQRSGTATDVTSAYSYGSAILLPNTGAELAIYNAGDGTTDGSLIFSMNYGNSGFPSATGASICLNPESLDPALAKLGTNWCVSITQFNTGDLGTPGAVNDACMP